MKDRVLKLLREIEWSGPSDYSRGVRTCPVCGRRGDVRHESPLFQGHSDKCELNRMIKEFEKDETE